MPGAGLDQTESSEALSLGEKHVPDVTRRGRKTDTAGLSPSGLVDLMFVSNR